MINADLPVSHHRSFDDDYGTGSKSSGELPEVASAGAAATAAANHGDNECPIKKG